MTAHRRRPGGVICVGRESFPITMTARRDGGSPNLTTLLARNLRVGAAVGLGAYLLGYLVTFLFTSVDGVDSGEVAGWKFAGMIFYAAHTVRAEFTATVEGASDTDRFDLFGPNGPENLGSTVPEPLYFLVPVAVLVAAGYLLYARVDWRLSLVEAAAVGTTPTVGYLAAAVLGTALFESTSSGSLFGVSGSTTLGPDLVPAVLLAGLLYPLVCGAVGGALGSLAE